MIESQFILSSTFLSWIVTATKTGVNDCENNMKRERFIERN